MQFQKEYYDFKDKVNIVKIRLYFEDEKNAGHSSPSYCENVLLPLKDFI